MKELLKEQLMELNRPIITNGLKMTKNTLSLFSGLTFGYSILFIISYLTIYQWWVKWLCLACYLYTGISIMYDEYKKSRKKK